MLEHIRFHWRLHFSASALNVGFPSLTSFLYLLEIPHGPVVLRERMLMLRKSLVWLLRQRLMLMLR